MVCGAPFGTISTTGRIRYSNVGLLRVVAALGLDGIGTSFSPTCRLSL